jgi:hypothetical protein
MRMIRAIVALLALVGAAAPAVAQDYDPDCAGRDRESDRVEWREPSPASKEPEL